MDREFIFGTKQTDMLGIGFKIPVVEKGNSGGPTETSILEVGRTTKEKDLELKYGQPVKNMKVSGKMIKKKDKVFFIGPMATNMKVNSEMDKFMESES
jgi:hypothetical protein